MNASTSAPRRSICVWIFLICGVWLIGLGLYFALLRPALLPEDPRFIGASLAEIQAALPGLPRWLSHVFRVMGGFMTAAGALTIFMAVTAVPARTRGTGWTLFVAGLFTVVLMRATNFAIESEFKWVLLAPAVLWLAGLGRYLAER